MVGRGRKKTKTELIEDKKARDVCFCKRRAGLFKKAREISVLCGAKVGVLIFSTSGKPKTFDAPTLQTLINQQLRHQGCSSDDIPSMESESPPPAAGAETMAPFWWERPDVGSMTLDELKTFASSLSAAIEERNMVKDGWNAAAAASTEKMMNASSFDCCPTPGIEEQTMMNNENLFIPGGWQLSVGGFEDEPSRIDGRQLVASNILPHGSPAVDASKNASFQPSSLTWTDLLIQHQWI